jgi:hypothetical protein
MDALKRVKWFLGAMDSVGAMGGWKSGNDVNALVKNNNSQWNKD